MKSSLKSVKASSVLTSAQTSDLLSGLPKTSHDPYEILDDLMVVVEELCPRWPERPLFKDTDKFLL